MTAKTLDARRAEQLAEIFKVLADPTRLQLLGRLLDDELCVHELADGMAVSQSAVSHQLRVLRDRRLVRARREGKHMVYRLDDVHVRELLTGALAHLDHD